MVMKMVLLGVRFNQQQVRSPHSKNIRVDENICLFWFVVAASMFLQKRRCMFMYLLYHTDSYSFSLDFYRHYKHILINILPNYYNKFYYMQFKNIYFQNEYLSAVLT